jgi:large subunit ribosomal protein L29
MSAKEFQQKSTEELQGILLEKSEQLSSLRVDVALNRLSNVREIRSTKRDIARIRTILRKRALQNERPANQASSSIK